MKVKGLILITFIALLMGFSGYAQKNHSKQFKEILTDANLLFDTDDFKSALQKYISIYKEDSVNEKINLNIAICMYKLKEFPDSILPYLIKVDKSAFAEAQFYEAKILHLQHNFDEAIVHYKKYKTFDENKRQVKNGEVDRLIEISKHAAEYMRNPHKAVIKNLGPVINTKYPEYVPLISADESVLYFTSRRPGSTGDLTDAWGNYYEDVYVSYNKDGEWTKPSNVGPPINTKTHDACVALSADAQQMIIYKTSKDELSGDLYATQVTATGWTNPVKIGPQINTEYKEVSACFSPDGNSIVFSSDKPGGVGGKDLYRVAKLPNGKWSLPSNLSGVVNTKYDEDAPFISADGSTLYFSSKGHETMGEYDIFKCTINENGTFTRTEDVGYPINTVGDDIYFVVTASAKHGYYSSLNENRDEAGYESEDIYFVDMHYAETDLIVKKGMVFQGKSERPTAAKITLTDKETNKVSGIYNSNSNTGYFIMVLNPFVSYKMVTECKGYESITMDLEAITKQAVVPVVTDDVLKILFTHK
jgi:tetratricopeptide (TPR) repeat protein